MSQRLWEKKNKKKAIDQVIMSSKLFEAFFLNQTYFILQRGACCAAETPLDVIIYTTNTV